MRVKRREGRPIYIYISKGAGQPTRQPASIGSGSVFSGSRAYFQAPKFNSCPSGVVCVSLDRGYRMFGLRHPRRSFPFPCFPLTPESLRQKPKDISSLPHKIIPTPISHITQYTRTRNRHLPPRNTFLYRSQTRGQSYHILSFSILAAETIDGC